ncbi:hypothetical protein [Rhodococcus qingshengii]|uniref:hypothetical protein n=1 Tax=Rhodococcus qingshengii TaxID=334542 RepID=UPI001BE6C04F|nr:hypothetical protein [Rhodococcus qingshengii]MBT2273806.1 hypothetical protein [Rhodococcus qingshengii]
MVIVDDVVVGPHCREGKGVRWRDVDEIHLVKWADGPVGGNRCIVLIANSSQRSCTVPDGRLDDLFLYRLLMLPGFDIEAMARALRTEEDMSVLLWSR